MSKQKKPRKEKKLRNLDVKILQGLADHNPRNRSETAIKLRMPRETLRYRINYLKSHFSLNLLGNVYHTSIGLRKVVVRSQSKPGYEDVLYDILKSNDYWLYVSQCIGGPNCLAIYAVPAEREKEFEDFAEHVRSSGIVTDVSYTWSTCMHTVNATSTWFDSRKEEWVFPWDSWLAEIPTAKGELPYTLKESGGYPQQADRIDIIILKELEKNCAIKMIDIADMLNMSLQRVRYHFVTHIAEKRMFEGPQILAEHYRGLDPDTYFFVFSFNDYGNFEKFALSLLDKPFVRSMGKIYQKNDLYVQIYLPRKQLRNFTDALARLVRNGFLGTYEYLIQDLTRTERQTIPYEFFKKNSWEYDQQKYLNRLEKAVSQLKS
jgi:DNA-binding Lrp family transcriptional regulator